MDFPLDTWGRVQVRCRLGQPDPGIGREGLKDYGVWQLKVQLPGQPEKVFNQLKIADQEFANLNWVALSAWRPKRRNSSSMIWRSSMSSDTLGGELVVDGMAEVNG